MKKKTIITFLLSLLALIGTQAKENADGQPSSAANDGKAKLIAQAELPEGAVFDGDFLSCTTWTDKLGTNYLVTSQTQWRKREPEDLEVLLCDKEIFAYHYVAQGGSLKRLWKLLDFIHDCELGAPMLDYLHTLFITDADWDGICETWLIYRVDCIGDGGPLGTKLIMHIGEKKYAIRGEADYWTETSVKNLGSPPVPDAAYKTLPQRVQDTGMVIWYRYQTWNFGTEEY